MEEDAEKERRAECENVEEIVGDGRGKKKRGRITVDYYYVNIAVESFHLAAICPPPSQS